MRSGKSSRGGVEGHARTRDDPAVVCKTRDTSASKAPPPFGSGRKEAGIKLGPRETKLNRRTDEAKAREAAHGQTGVGSERSKPVRTRGGSPRSRQRSAGEPSARESNSEIRTAAGTAGAPPIPPKPAGSAVVRSKSRIPKRAARPLPVLKSSGPAGAPLGTSRETTLGTKLKVGRPRIEEKGRTIEAQKPWVAAGMSRRTWYARRAEQSKAEAK